ncbi:uncharacterized protein ACOB7L_005888 isoform 2-T3 [Callospermophilus lateralis]
MLIGLFPCPFRPRSCSLGDFFGSAHATQPIGLKSRRIVGRRDIINGAREKCVLPPMDGYPHYEGKIKWMKDMWRSDRCYADYGVDGSTCSFFIYLSENRKIYLDIIHTYMEVHATVYGSSTKNISSYVKNHGILNGRDLQFLLRETKQVCPGHQKKKRRGSYGRKIPAASGSREIIITDIRDCWADIPASVC